MISSYYLHLWENFSHTYLCKGAVTVGTMAPLTWLQRSEGQSLRVSKEIKDTSSLLWIKGPVLILTLFLYIDEHESPLLWIVSFWALGLDPEDGLINNASYLTMGCKC